MYWSESSHGSAFIQSAAWRAPSGEVATSSVQSTIARRVTAALNRSVCPINHAASRPPFTARRRASIEPCDATKSTARSKSSASRSEEHTSELQSLRHLVCRLLLEKKKKG